MEAIRAVSSPQTKAPAPSLTCSWKLKSVPRMLSPSRPYSSACSMAIFRRLMASGILGAAVDVAFFGADGVAAQHHAFEQAVRVALDDGAVHEGAGVAFVGVADDVLDVARGLGGEFPLEAGQEAGAATAAQAGVLDFLDDRFGRHLEQGLGQSRVAAAGDVLLDALGVDHAAVAAARCASASCRTECRGRRARPGESRAPCRAAAATRRPLISVSSTIRGTSAACTWQ